MTKTIVVRSLALAITLAGIGLSPASASAAPSCDSSCWIDTDTGNCSVSCAAGYCASCDYTPGGAHHESCTCQAQT